MFRRPATRQCIARRVPPSRCRTRPSAALQRDAACHPTWRGSARETSVGSCSGLGNCAERGRGYAQRCGLIELARHELDETENVLVDVDGKVHDLLVKGDALPLAIVVRIALEVRQTRICERPWPLHASVDAEEEVATRELVQRSWDEGDLDRCAQGWGEVQPCFARRLYPLERRCRR